MLAVHISAVLLLLTLLQVSCTHEILEEDEDSPDCKGPVSYSGYQLLTLSPATKRQRKNVIRLSGKQGVHFWLAQRNAVGGFIAQVLLSPDAVPRVTKRLRDKAIPFKSVIEEQAVSGRDSAVQLAREGHPLSWSKYHRLKDIHAYMKHVSQVHPNVASLVNAGRSYEGRDLLVLRLGASSPHQPQGAAKPVIWIDGANQIACWGVDANRNWDSHWGERAGSKDPCSHNYPGPKAAVSELLLRLRPAVYLSLHSYSQLWLMPWGHTSDAPEQDARLRSVALKALEAIQDAGGNQYLAGSSLDWAHEKAGADLAYLVELRDTGDHGFVLPPREIEPTGEEMLAAVKSMARELLAEEQHTKSH
ncbi:hypothetical protein B566_EDAN002942 [Ephemera danica]|nr:hypothetical protein B566_EDAN002942 [Ephemera danica]